MSDKTRCKICSAVMYRDEDCARCSGAIAPAAAPEKDRPIPYTGPLPAYDPLVQEARDYWTPRIGREAARELNPDCDPLDGERR